MSRGGVPTAEARSPDQKVSAAIAATLREYEIAWSTKDRTRLRRIWQMTREETRETDSILERAVSIGVRARIVDVSMISSTSAAVHVEETREVVGRGRGRPPTQTRSRLFRLEKHGAEWIIVGIGN